jgi:hypothetical protein
MLHYYLEEPWEGLDRSIMYALDHDEEEAISGDMPGTYKDYNLGVPWPNPAMLKRWEIPVRVADAMETYDWWKNWGNHCWMHQRSPEQGCDNRDIRKIVHYTQGWPELLEAVRQTMQISLGYTDFYVKGMLG